ncbi:MAG: type II secretion system minor pseudopilin GspI [Pseudomonadota bacterium]
MPADVRGFTLIEVMVALVVFVAVALALDSMMGANVNSQIRFEEKTLATWVASNKLVEMQVYQKWPENGRQDDESDFGGRPWFVRTEVTNGPFPDTRRVDISVGPKPDGMLEDKRSVATLTALLSRPETPPPVAPAGGTP